jgi:hypothetical protein
MSLADNQITNYDIVILLHTNANGIGAYSNKVTRLIDSGSTNMILLTDHEPVFTGTINRILQPYNIRMGGNNGQVGTIAINETEKTRDEFRGLSAMCSATSSSAVSTLTGQDLCCQYNYSTGGCMWNEVCVNSTPVQLVGSFCGANGCHCGSSGYNRAVEFWRKVIPEICGL